MLYQLRGGKFSIKVQNPNFTSVRVPSADTFLYIMHLTGCHQEICRTSAPMTPMTCKELQTHSVSFLYLKLQRCVNSCLINSSGKIPAISSKRLRFNFRPVTKAKVLRNLNNLKASKSVGPDNLPPRLLKDAAKALSDPLTHLINLSFKHSTFPKRLKIAKVIPLFKSGPRENLDN